MHAIYRQGLGFTRKTAPKCGTSAAAGKKYPKAYIIK
jgi:hypothetical protein